MRKRDMKTQQWTYKRVYLQIARQIVRKSLSLLVMMRHNLFYFVSANLLNREFIIGNDLL